MTDLAERPNPSHWADLLDLALPLLDTVFMKQHIDPAPEWTLGGGTAIALHLAHRISDDVDLFIGGTDLRLFIPPRNPRAAALGASMQFPGNDLKFTLQTGEEVVLKKIRYRATAFKPRDVFDLAAVAAHSTTLSTAMVQETGDRLPTLLTAIRRHDARSFETANIRVLPGYEQLLETALADAEHFVAGLIDGPAGRWQDKTHGKQRSAPGAENL